MDLPAAWSIEGETPVADCRVFAVSSVEARSPSTQRVHTFYRIAAPAWVNVVPITPDGHVVMVRQYRHGSRTVTLEIPGGVVDPGERPEDAARRELLEETGHAADALRAIGVVNPNPALFSNPCHTFLATGVRAVAPIQNQGAEETSLALVPVGEVDDRLARGEIDHALVVAALLWWRLASG